MKINGGVYKRQVSCSAIFKNVYGGEIDGCGCMHVHNFLILSPLFRKELIETLILNGKREVLEKFLRNVESVINYGGTLKISEDVRRNARYALVDELLLWHQWWGFAASLPIYRISFLLLYYGEKYQTRQMFENFSISDDDVRKKIIEGLLKDKQTEVLDTYCCQVQSELQGDCYRRYLRTWGENARVLWFKEFAMWQRLGFDFSSHPELSIAMINSFVRRQDASRLATFLRYSDFKFPKKHISKLQEFVLNAPFKKEYTQKIFLRIIEKYIAVA